MNENEKAKVGGHVAKRREKREEEEENC